jgi:hypothetical protein
MSFLKMERVNQLPDQLDPDTMYFVASPDGVHFNLFVTGNDNTAVGTASNTDSLNISSNDLMAPTTVSLGTVTNA